MESTTANVDEESQPEVPSHRSETRPQPLQNYYDAVGWVGVLRDRLEELELERQETRVIRRPPSGPDGLPRLQQTESESHFRDEQGDLLRQIEEVQRQADMFEQQCNELGIEIKVKAPSSIVHSDLSLDPSETNLAEQAETPFKPLTVQRPRRITTKSKHLSSRRRKTKNPLKPQKAPFAEAGSFINRWVSKVWNQINASGQQSTEGTLASNGISMRSTASLPDYIRVNTLPLEWQKSSESEQERNAAIRQNQASIGMSAERTFTHKRAYHSDSSLLSRGAKHNQSSALRRTTIYEFSRSSISRLHPSQQNHRTNETRRPKQESTKPRYRSGILPFFGL